jgi:hypothetical protein
MPRLLALQSWTGRKAGEEFDASDADAKLLCAPDGLGGQKARVLSRDMRADDPPPAAAPATPIEQPETKRRYLRRDLRAQK